MKITIYTITNCEFSKQEKEYLKSHNLPFEEKNLETNREFLTEMMTVGNNFAGTPVTKIEKDDGKIEVLKGFTEEDFDKILGFKEKPTEPTPAVVQTPPVATVSTPPPAAPAIEEPKAEEPKTNTQLDAILNDLKDAQNAATEQPVVPTVTPEPTIAPPTPVVSPPIMPDLPTPPTPTSPTPAGETSTGQS